MRIPVLIISAASLVVLGGVARADDHLFQAVTEGGLGGNDNQQATVKSDAPGRGSPFTSFGDETGVPSADPDDTASEHGAHDLPDQAGGPKQ
jgi:hypothetical protein